MARVWIIPGMDGTGRLSRPLGSLVRSAGALPERDVRLVRYEGGSYDEAFASLPEALRAPAPDDVIVAESFGGPLGIRIASMHRIARLVLVASFVRSPRALPPSALAGWLHPPPRVAVRVAMLGRDAPAALVDEVCGAIAEVPASVIAARIDALRSLDVTSELAAVPSEVIWLRATADRLVPPLATAVARRARPSLVVHDVQGPHLLAQRWPHRVAALIRG